MDEVECVVIGAGVVGLAVGRALAQAGHEVLVLEAEGAIGTQTSSRNSEVIHAGIYYPRDSLMARHCVAGNRMLYAYCAERGIGHRRCGKLVVATSEEEAGRLDSIRARAEANGVPGMRLLSADEARAMEPALSCTGAVLSESTGIVDSHGFMLALQGELEEAGGSVALHSRLLRAAPAADGRGLALLVGEAAPDDEAGEDEADGFWLRARIVVNAAGLQAPSVARRIEGQAPDAIPGQFYAKGCYFTLSGRAPFSRLIYPVPVQGGLGVHLTVDLGGQMRFGPDVEWVDRLDYRVDPARAASFYGAVRRYWPGLPDDSLAPDYSGIRPKIRPPGGGQQDFVVAGPAAHGLPGLVNLFGIESPGLTAALSLAGHVRAVAEGEAA